MIATDEFEATGAIAQLANFRVARYRLALKAVDTLFLPPYKGSTFRGAFGNVFKRICCANRTPVRHPSPSTKGMGGEPSIPQDECHGCLLQGSCPYAYVFDTAPPEGGQALRKNSDVPRPFVLEPPLERKELYKPGEELVFHLILIGRGIEYLPYFIVAFREMGEVGIGRGRGRFELAEVRGVPHGVAEDEFTVMPLVYEGGQGRVQNVPETVVTGQQILEGSTATKENFQKEEKEPSATLQLDFLTMTRLTHEGHLVEKPEFHVVMRNLVRRLSSLAVFHHGFSLEMDFRAFFEAAEGISLATNRTRWEDWERYSSRQQTRMKLGGIVGQTIYSGAPELVDTYLPWLRLGEAVHIGKGATFGLGKVRVE